MRRGRWLAVGGVLAVVATAGIVVAVQPRPSDRAGAAVPVAAPAQPSTSATRPTVAPSATVGHIPALPDGPTGPAHATAPAAALSSPPVRLLIPSIGVDTALQDLGLQPDGELQSPSQWQVAGWFAGGVRPGDDGPAVIAGHVDSVNGPAVFYQLKQLTIGTPVQVVRANGTTLHFTVGQRQEFPKNTFPTEAVYGPTPLPVLRLVTCTGDFDYQARSYVDNLVLTAYLTSS